MIFYVIFYLLTPAFTWQRDLHLSRAFKLRPLTTDLELDIFLPYFDGTTNHKVVFMFRSWVNNFIQVNFSLS